MQKNNHSRVIKPVFWLILAIFIDQAIKFALRYFSVNYGRPDLIFENRGFAFSISANFWLILAVSLGLLLIYIIVFIKFYDTWPANMACALILAGGTSNIIDRITLGYVTDYLRLGHGFFNLADVFIFLGVLGLGWVFFGPKASQKPGD